jgi:hypothetical protein
MSETPYTSESNCGFRAPLLDLAKPRTIAIEDRGRSYKLHCRRITDRDWTEYFNKIVFSSEQKSGREQINSLDVSTPRIVLAEAGLERVEGYRVSNGGDIHQLEDWRKKVPLAHRSILGAILADARPAAQGDDLTIHAEGDEVLIDATWSAVDSPEGKTTMQRFRGLKHVLKTPSDEQFRRYASQTSRSIVVGGSRGGRTIYPNSNFILAQLYDELVIAVDGYAIGDKPLQTDREAIRREMDMLHKVIVAQEIFNPTSTAQLAGADQELQSSTN